MQAVHVVSVGEHIIFDGTSVAASPQRQPSASARALAQAREHLPSRHLWRQVSPRRAFDSENEAVALANNSQYRLSASIWSRDVDRPLRIARQIEAGTVWINNWAVVYAETEEGGYKQSGLGRLDGVSGMDDFVQYRTIIHEIDLEASHQ